MSMLLALWYEGGGKRRGLRLRIAFANGQMLYGLAALGSSSTGGFHWSLCRWRSFLSPCWGSELALGHGVMLMCG